MEDAVAIKENVAILSSVMPRNGDEEKKSKRLYGHQLLPYYESLENVLDEDTYRALQKIMVSGNTWQLIPENLPRYRASK